MPKLGPMELVLILVIVLVVFGVGKLPQIGSAIGKSIRAFKDGQAGEDEEAATSKKTRKKQVKKSPAKQSVKTTTEAVAQPPVTADATENADNANNA